MYVVSWARTAVTQLHEKVHDNAVRHYLIDVSQTSLHLHRPLYGGELGRGRPGRKLGKFWRRGLTGADEARIAEQERAECLGEAAGPGRALGHGYLAAMDYVLAYDRVGHRVGEHEYVVRAVVANVELAASYVAARPLRVGLRRAPAPPRGS